MLMQDLQACAVNHLHRLGIIHRDIKLENVMLKDDGRVVLGDFDLAVRLPVKAPGSPALRRAFGAFKTRGVCGTLPYMAPEVLRNMEYSYAVDWFAYGVFLHVFYLDKVRFRFFQWGLCLPSYIQFPWLGEYEHPASYLKEMMSTISLGLIFRNNGLFGDLLNEVGI
jgi:serine/threonine protein kinase